MNRKLNHLKLKTKLAGDYFADGDYARALNFIDKLQGSHRRQFKLQEFEAHYHLGTLACAENDFSTAHNHFSEAVHLAQNPADLKLCQARLATLKRLILTPSPPLPDSIKDRRHNHPDCTPDKSFYDCASSEYIRAIYPAENLSVDALQPDIDATYAVGAYKSWWDKASENPYTQALKMAQRPQSQILLEPLGILLAEFIAGGAAASLRKSVDFICPIPTEATNPNSWRYKMLAIIGDVISRRFGIPVFSAIEAFGATRRGRKSCYDGNRGAFKITDTNLVEGRNILLLDDIATYRKTVKQASLALKAAGAKTINAILLAYTEPAHQ